MTLNDVELKKEYIVRSIDNSNKTSTNRLLALGFIPGAKVSILQHTPYPICVVGNSKIALDKTLAGLVYVR